MFFDPVVRSERPPNALPMLLSLMFSVVAATGTTAAQSPPTQPTAEAPASRDVGPATQSGQPVHAPAGRRAAAPASAEPSTQGEPDKLASAKKQLARGKQFFESDDYDAALTEFTRAYEMLDGHPNQFIVLNNLAVCHERMFRYDLALDYYQRYLHQGSTQAEDRAEVEATVRTLRGMLATLVIDSNVKAEVWVDDRVMGEAPGRVLVPAGRHVIEVRASLRESSQQEVQIGAREEQTLTFSLIELSTFKGASPAYTWTGVGLTAVAATVGAVFAIQAKNLDSEGQDTRKRLGAQGLSREDEDAVADKALVADVFFGAAAVLGVATAVLYFMTDWSEDEAPFDELGVVATPDGVAAAWGGTF